MQLYAANFIPLLGSLYMFQVFYTPIIRSTTVIVASSRSSKLFIFLPAWNRLSLEQKEYQEYFLSG
jgi:hypothetical protein